MNMNELHISFKRAMEEEVDIPSEMEDDATTPLPSPEDGPENNLQRAIRAIEAEGYEYKIVKNEIRVLDDNRQETMQKLEQMLSPLGFVYNPNSTRSSLGRLELKAASGGSAYVVVKQKRRTAASAGMDFEEKLATEITSRYRHAGITATTAGFGHGSDLTILKNGRKMMSIELKTALSADFGQFRIEYNIQSKSWEPRRTAGFVKNEKVFGSLFNDYLRDWLNHYAKFPDLYDRRLNLRGNSVVGLLPTQKTGELKKDLQTKWFDGKTDKKVPFEFSRIAGYYADKGDSFIQIGQAGLYALKTPAQTIIDVPMFGDLGLNCDLRLRLKPSMGANSSTSFTVAVKIKGRYKKSNLSLTNPQDLDKIISML